MTGSRISGRVLIAGTASLLMCLFLSPKFIEFLRRREFGQNIREEGPEGHQTKAGTPTMGGIIIFTAIAVPFLTAVDARLGSRWGVRRRRRLRAAGLRRRLHEDRQAPLARAAGAHQARGDDRDLARAVVGGDPEGGHRLRPCGLRFVDVTSTSGRCIPVFIYLVVAGTTTRRQLHRRPRRPGRRLRGDRPPGLHRDHVHHPGRARPDAARRAAWSAPASAFCGSTASRRASSWATPARSG